MGFTREIRMTDAHLRGVADEYRAILNEGTAARLAQTTLAQAFHSVKLAAEAHGGGCRYGTMSA
jgi:hypothetical protein